REGSQYRSTCLFGLVQLGVECRRLVGLVGRFMAGRVARALDCAAPLLCDSCPSWFIYLESGLMVAGRTPRVGWHLRWERRIEQPFWLQLLTPFLLIAAALLIGALVLWATGANPWALYRRMAFTAFGSAYGWSDTTIKATPLILAGLGVSIAFRARL